MPLRTCSAGAVPSEQDKASAGAGDAAAGDYAQTKQRATAVAQVADPGDRPPRPAGPGGSLTPCSPDRSPGTVFFSAERAKAASLG